MKDFNAKQSDPNDPNDSNDPNVQTGQTGQTNRNEATPGPHPGVAVWDRRFAATDEFIFGTEPNRFLLSQAHRFVPGMKVLAVADGEGRNGVWLSQQGLDVVSVDGSRTALAKASSLAAQRSVRLETVCADLVSWDWGIEMYDAIVGIFIQFAGPHLRPTLFQRAHRSLRPGGLFLLEGYTPRQLDYRTGGPSNIEHLYTEAQLRAELVDFQIDSLTCYDTVLNEGSGHCGMSALVDVVAHKP